MTVKKQIFKIGQTINVTNAVTGIPVGTKGKIIRTQSNNYYIDSYPNNYLRSTEMELWEETVEMISENILSLEAEIKLEKQKLAFMKANKVTIFNPDEFKVFEVLNTLEKSSSKIEKARIITALINS